MPASLTGEIWITQATVARCHLTSEDEGSNTTELSSDLMGSFWRLTYHDGSWRPEAAGEPSLTIDVHDSDIATIDYRPAGPDSSGRFYLGTQPCDYFDDPTASDPVDLEAEAAGFAIWARSHVGSSVVVEQLLPLLATGDTEEPLDAFVDDTVVRLLDSVGIPQPTEDEIDSGDSLH